MTKRRSKLVKNKKSISKPEPFQKLVANVDGIVRNENLNSTDYLVVPMIMAVEGVLDGSMGALFYPAEELKQLPVTWNTKPTVVNHPEDEPSACIPVVLEESQIGIIMNSHFEKGKLKAEAWLETHLIEKVDNRILEAINNKETLELSTGVFVDIEKTSGEFNGVHYDGIVRNLRPDHLAVLPDQLGACSIEDGAGFLRLNSSRNGLIVDISKVDEDKKDYLLANTKQISLRISNLLNNEMSHSDIWMLLSSALREINEEAWIDEVFDDFFIYREDGKLYMQHYTVATGEADFVGVREQVKSVHQFQKMDGTVLNNVINRKEDKMKKQIVDGLIANAGTNWTEEQRELLMNMDEDTLKLMVPVENEGDNNNQEENNEEENSQQQTTTENKAKSLSECLKDMPPEMQDAIRNGIATNNANKEELVAYIVDNENNTFSKEQLEEKGVDELKRIANLCATEKKPAPSMKHDFSGLRETKRAANTHVEEPLKVTTLNFDEKKKDVA